MEGVVTSSFGARVNPITGKKEVHNGIDIAVASGTAVKAVQDAVITEVGEDRFSGVYVRYKTDNGFSVTYAHLSKVTVKKDEKVKRGQQIATSGSTGISSGAHLHYTLWKDEELIDPMKYVDLPYTDDVKQEYAYRGE